MGIAVEQNMLTTARRGLILTRMGGRAWSALLVGAVLAGLAAAGPARQALAATPLDVSAVAPCLAQPAGTKFAATEGMPVSATLATFGAPTQDQLFSAQLFLDLLKRAPTCVELSLLSGLLAGGATPGQVATATVNGSEYLRDEISSFFAALLGRAPSAAEAAAGVAFMQGGATETDVQVAIISSPEYALLHPTTDALVTAIYQDLLGRPPTSLELAAGDAVLVAFGAGDVARPILLGSEYNGKLVAPLYESLLGRLPTAIEKQVTLSELELGTALRLVVAGIAGSFEYFAKRFPPTFSASVDWGDGSSSPATLAPTPGGYSVGGSHLYEEEGAFAVTVSVMGSDGSSFTVSATATVADAPLTASGLSVEAQAGASGLNRPLVAGVRTGPLLVARFADSDPGGMASDFTATIDWGDSTLATVGTITANPGGGFAVVGEHTYAIRGEYQITVLISDKGGAQAPAPSTASVRGRSKP